MGLCEWLPMPVGATGAARNVRSGGETSLATGWTTAGALLEAAVAVFVCHAWPETARIAPLTASSRVRTDPVRTLIQLAIPAVL